jgi:hypothetical protein
MGIQAGKGTVVRRGNAVNADFSALPAHASDVFTVVPKVLNVDLPDFERTSETYEILDAGSDVKIPNAASFGDYVLTLLYDKANSVHALLYSESRSATPQYRNYEVVTPDNETHRFVAAAGNWASDTLEPTAPRQPTITLTPVSAPTVV